MSAMTASAWEIGRLRLRPELILSMAVNSLRLRFGRTLLTVLTISTASAFLIFLLTLPQATAAHERQTWGLMLVLCLLVSAAGVLNTMLMSVTQRYREIGTMKCLGALDSFILCSVLLEAALLGLAGAFLGLIVGLIISVLFGLLQYGGAVFATLQFDGLWWKAVFAFAVGLFLSTLGAAMPSYIASRMPPMDAMRGEK